MCVHGFMCDRAWVRECLHVCPQAGAQAQHILKCSDMLLSLDLGVRAHVSLGAHIWHLCGDGYTASPSPPLGLGL